MGARTGAAEHGPDSGHQLLGAERLGQVIVGTGIQTGDAVRLGRAGRQHDHGDLALPPHQPQQLETVQARHHHVQEQQVVPAVERPGQTSAPVVDSLQADVATGEELLQQFAKLAIVVDEQDRHRRLRDLCRLARIELTEVARVPSNGPYRATRS